jgi:hypothetical protein
MQVENVIAVEEIGMLHTETRTIAAGLLGAGIVQRDHKLDRLSSTTLTVASISFSLAPERSSTVVCLAGCSLSNCSCARSDAS